MNPFKSSVFPRWKTAIIFKTEEQLFFFFFKAKQSMGKYYCYPISWKQASPIYSLNFEEKKGHSSEFPRRALSIVADWAYPQPTLVYNCAYKKGCINGVFSPNKNLHSDQQEMSGKCSSVLKGIMQMCCVEKSLQRFLFLTCSCLSISDEKYTLSIELVTKRRKL